MTDYPFTKCVECDWYELMDQACVYRSESRKPMDNKCGEDYACCTVPPEEIQQKLFDLVWSLEYYIGGKYYSLAPICDARKGICPKGKNGKCTFDKKESLSNGIGLISIGHCEFKQKFENPEGGTPK